MAAFGNIEIKQERRLCTVDGRLGYFHGLEHYSKPVTASPLKGGAPAGVISFVRGIVEFPERIEYVSPTDIEFCDDEHAMLCEMSEHNDKTLRNRFIFQAYHNLVKLRDKTDYDAPFDIDEVIGYLGEELK